MRSWRVVRTTSIILLAGGLISCSLGVEGDPSSTYTMLVADAGVEIAPALGVRVDGTEQPDMLSNTWYDYDDRDLEDTFISGSSSYRGSFQIQISGEDSALFEGDGEDAPDFYLLQYGKTDGYVMYVFTERFDSSTGPQSDPIAILSLDGAGPLTLDSADFSSVPFGDPEVIPFATDIPDTNNDGDGDILDFDSTGSIVGTDNGPAADFDNEYRWLLDEERLDNLPGVFESLFWQLEKKTLP